MTSLVPTDDVPPDVRSDDPAADAAPARARRVLRVLGRRTADVVAVLAVWGALLAPSQTSRFGVEPFLRLPVEGIIAAEVALLLRGRARRIVLRAAGAVLGLLTVLKVLDLGFDATIVRPFDPVLDWVLVGAGLDFVRSVAGGGRSGQVAVLVVVVLVALLAAAVVWGMTRAVLRCAALVVRRERAATRVVAALAVVWLGAAVLGLQWSQGLPAGKGIPVAARDVAASVHDHTLAVRQGLEDERTFAARAANDKFAAVPGDRLLTGLRGKDVLLTFVESYGRTALTDPQMANAVDPVVADGERRLRAAGFAARSGWLTSSTAGGGSWFAHATLQSGMWSYNLATYRPLISSDRLTLTSAFGKAGWDTVAFMPAIHGAWPEANFYKYGKVYDATNIGYTGPHFSWSQVPDQYALEQLDKRVLALPGRKPVMAEIALTSSHAPWAPLPTVVPWDRAGDSAVYGPMPAAGEKPGDLWPDATKVRGAYADSLRYTLQTLFEWLERYGDENTVLIFLGDHQPVPIVTGPDASHDVPVTVVAKDPAVLDRISSWGWTDGLRPDPKAPVWPMDAFRDKFLTAFA